VCGSVLGMFEREPVAAGFVAFDGLVLSVVALGQAFGFFELSVEQNAAVFGFVGALSAVVAALVRARVVPVKTFEEFQVEAADLVDTAHVEGFNLGLFTPVPDDVVAVERFGYAEGS
jgi:hypothetical protein